MCCIFFRARVSYLSLSVSRRMLWKIAPTIRNMLCVVRRIRHSVKICKWQVSSREFSKKKTRSSTNLKSKVGIKTEYIDKSDTVWNCDSRNVVVQWIKFHAIVSVCSKFSRGGANNLKSKILTDVTFHLSRKIHVQVYVYIYIVERLTIYDRYIRNRGEKNSYPSWNSRISKLSLFRKISFLRSRKITNVGTRGPVSLFLCVCMCVCVCVCVFDNPSQLDTR